MLLMSLPSAKQRASDVQGVPLDMLAAGAD
jgi:hypothetical protein